MLITPLMAYTFSFFALNKKKKGGFKGKSFYTEIMEGDLIVMENGFGFSFELYETIFKNCFIYSSKYKNGNLQLSLFRNGSCYK